MSAITEAQTIIATALRCLAEGDAGSAQDALLDGQQWLTILAEREAVTV